MEYIYRVAAEQLFGVKVPEGPLEMRQLRNSDFQETTLQASSIPCCKTYPLDRRKLFTARHRTS